VEALGKGQIVKPENRRIMDNFTPEDKE